MPELVVIPISFFEFAVDYELPEFQLLADRANIVQGIFEALKPWDPRIDEVEVISVGKLSEQGINLKLPLKSVSFFFGAASFKFKRENVDWKSADETFAILDTALSALIRLSRVKIAMQKTAIAMHIQPRSLPFVDILRPFIAGRLASLEAEPITTMAAVAKWSSRKVTIDGSAALANGVFLRLERDFPGATTYEAIAQQLKKDEEDLFEILGVEEDRG